MFTARSLISTAMALAIMVAGCLIGVSVLTADPISIFDITNVDSPDPVASGQELTYTITVTNTGGAKATEVVLSSQINGVGGIGVPPQLVLTSTRGSCAQNTNLVTCSAGELEGRGVWVVTIRGIVTAASGTTLNNTASVTGTKSAQNFTSAATATTRVSSGGGSPLPDLSIAKAGPTSVPVSSPMTYTLTVNNTGTANATGVMVVDTVPSGLTGVSASGTSLFTCGVAGQTVTCTGGAVNQGSNATITINATSPAATGTITNTASVDPEEAIAEANELNNTSALVNTQVTSGPAPPALPIVNTDDPAVLAGAGPDPVHPGALLTYKMLVTNNAATRADDVVVVNGTQGLEAASISVNQVITNGTVGVHGGCSVAAPEVRCTIRSLNPGGTMLVTVAGQVVASAGSTIFDTATVTGNIANTGFSSTDTELTTVKPAVDLTITKADSPDPTCARSWPTAAPPASPPLLGPPVCLGGLTYTLVVGNSGITTATGVRVRDPLPSNTRLDSFVAPAFAGGCAADAGNVVSCTGGTIGPESTTTIAFVIVAPPNVGPITNTVTVDPFNAIFEADETNNTASQATQIATGIDLAILKTDVAPGFDPIATSGTQTYTITVDNLGPQDATNILVRDVLPAGAVFRSAVGDNGFTCSHAGGVVDCFGGSILGTASEFYPPFGAPGNDTATITIRVFARPTIGTGVDAMHNEVRVDPFNQIAEINEANNIDFEDTDVGSGGGGIGAFNQLTIAKTQVSPNPDNTARNAVVTYEIKIGNDATDPAVNVRVRDFLPAGARYIEATGDHQFHCTQAGAFVECTGGNIPPSAGGAIKATITLKAFAPDTPGTYTNQAIVDPNFEIAEGNEFDNEAFAETKVKNAGEGAFNDLTILKDATEKTTPGGSITYTLTVTNLGSDPASNVAVRDDLPAGTTFLSADDTTGTATAKFTCSEAGGTVTCIGATLDGTVDSLPGITNVRQITIKVKAPNTINPALTNQAFVDPANAIPEGDELNNHSSDSTNVASKINLKVDKDGPKTSSQNQVTPYTIVVTNEEDDGGQDAFDVQLIDPLPVGLIPLSVDTGSGNNWQCSVAENPINLLLCNGDLGHGASVTITVEVFMTAEGGRSLDNEACVDPADVFKEFVKPDGTGGENDNCSTHTLLVGEKPKLSPDILVSKGVNTTLVSEGDSLTYTITVSNGGTAKAKTGLTLKDSIPGSLTIVGAPVTTNGWTCTVAGNDIECTDSGSGLGVGESATITVNATVNAGTTLPFANTAKLDPAALVDPGADPAVDYVDETNTANNDSTIVVGVSGAPFDLAIASITDNPDPANPGLPLKYTVVAVNGGTQNAPGVHVHVNIPTGGVIFDGADGTNGFNCGDPVLNVVDCVGDLPAGGNTVITVKLIVTLAPPGDLTLSATIDPANAFPDETNEGNNTDTEVTTVSGDTCVACIDLVASQLVATPDPATSGGSVTYKFVLVNTGDQPTSLLPAEPLLFFDVVGGYTSFSRSSSNPAVTCTTNGATTPGVNLFTDCFGNLGPGQGVTITVTFNGVSGASMFAQGKADPTFKVAEFKETNNIITQSVVILP